MKFSTVNDDGYTYKFYFNQYFYKAFKYGDGVDVWGYGGTNAKPLCAECCSFVQCHILVNYLTLSVCPSVCHLKSLINWFTIITTLLQTQGK
jgi:hypothetical protein